VTALGLTSALGLSSALLLFTPYSQLSAAAAPADPTEPFLAEAPGAFSGVVPDGICQAVVTAQGGAGGNALGGDDVNPGDDPPEEPAEPITAADLGRGALLKATYQVLPGQSFSGHVGGGGAGASVGGDNGANVDGATGNGAGGNGGTGGHPGAGGGALTNVVVGGIELLVAGAGGGSGGGHNADYGSGGNAGVPTAPGVVAAGVDGASGSDGVGDNFREPGGGEGGGESAPGSGGVHPTNDDLNGADGNGRDGGNGGADPGFDTGGGGGAGYHGGGGGASTITDGVPNGAAGGGGGASYVHATSPTADAAPVRAYEGLLGPAADPTRISAGPDGFVSIEWIPCAYDLEVTKSVGKVKYGKKGQPGRDNKVRIGDRVEWQVVITNRGPDPMTRGDVVDLVDSRAAEANLRIKRIGVSGGQAPSSLSSDRLSCNAQAGQRLPETLLCSRPYQVRPASLLDAPQPEGERGLNRGESLTVVYREKVLTAESLRNTATVTDRADGNERADTGAASVRVRKGNPRLTLDKTATPERITRAGQRITFTYRVRNTGNLAISDIQIDELKFTGSGKLAAPRCPSKPKVLKPGRTVTCKVTYRTTRKDVRAGRIVNKAVARGLAPDAKPVRSAADRAVVKGQLPTPPATGWRM